MIFKTMRRYASRLAAEQWPARFLVSRILRMSGLSRLFVINRGNYRIRFYPTALSATLWYNPEDRRDDETFLMRFLKKNDVFVDIGANIGSLTLLAASCVGEQGRVYAIEAHPRVFGYLMGNIKLNSFSNIVPYNLALSDRRGTVGFSDLHSDDQNSISLGKSDMEVDSVPLDMLDLGGQPIALIKIDVEGYEKFVLQGAMQVLERTEAVYFESSEKLYRNFGYGLADIDDMLSASGFNIFRISAGGLRRLQKGDLSDSPENLVAIRDADSFGRRTGIFILQS